MKINMWVTDLLQTATHVTDGGYLKENCIVDSPTHSKKIYAACQAIITYMWPSFMDWIKYIFVVQFVQAAADSFPWNQSIDLGQSHLCL